MKTATIVVASLLAVVTAWPTADITGYTSRTVYNGYQQAPMQTYVVEYAMPYNAPIIPPAGSPYGSQGYRSAPETLIRQKRQLMGGMGGGAAGAQAQAQSQSMGTGMGMGGMGFPYMMGFPFMG